MKRCLLIIALTLCLITTAIAESKQDVNPRQAGKSSIYFYDVECQSNPNPDCELCGPCSGYGTFVIDTKKKTFTFIGHDYTPMQNVHIKVKNIGIIAKGQVTKSGNIHIQGKWDDNIVPPEPGGVGTYYSYDPAYGFMGQQLGGYVAHLKVRYSKDGGNTWATTEKETGDVLFGQTFTVTVAQFTDSTHVINKGDLIQFKVKVIGGGDVWTDTWFTYVPDGDPMYCWPYILTHGTTWGAWIEYYDDACQRCLNKDDDNCNYWYVWGVDIP